MKSCRLGLGVVLGALVAVTGCGEPLPPPTLFDLHLLSEPVITPSLNEGRRALGSCEENSPRLEASTQPRRWARGSFVSIDASATVGCLERSSLFSCRVPGRLPTQLTVRSSDPSVLRVVSAQHVGTNTPVALTNGTVQTTLSDVRVEVELVGVGSANVELEAEGMKKTATFEVVAAASLNVTALLQPPVEQNRGVLLGVERDVSAVSLLRDGAGMRIVTRLRDANGVALCGRPALSVNNPTDTTVIGDAAYRNPDRRANGVILLQANTNASTTFPLEFASVGLSARVMVNTVSITELTSLQAAVAPANLTQADWENAFVGTVSLRAGTRDVVGGLFVYQTVPEFSALSVYAPSRPSFSGDELPQDFDSQVLLQRSSPSGDYVRVFTQGSPLLTADLRLP